jgi:hypothetical protein
MLRIPFSKTPKHDSKISENAVNSVFKFPRNTTRSADEKVLNSGCKMLKTLILLRMASNDPKHDLKTGEKTVQSERTVVNPLLPTDYIGVKHLTVRLTRPHGFYPETEQRATNLIFSQKPFGQTREVRVGCSQS